jgi:hypothetical protein
MTTRPSATQVFALLAGGALTACAYTYLFALWGIADKPLVRLFASSEGGFFLASLFSLCLFSLLVAALLTFVLSQLCGRYFNVAVTIFGIAFTISWFVLALIRGVPVMPASSSLVSFIALFAICTFLAPRARHA